MFSEFCRDKALNGAVIRFVDDEKLDDEIERCSCCADVVRPLLTDVKHEDSPPISISTTGPQVRVITMEVHVPPPLLLPPRWFPKPLLTSAKRQKEEEEECISHIRRQIL